MADIEENAPQQRAQAAPARPAHDPRVSSTSFGWLINNMEVEVEGGCCSAHEALTNALIAANKAAVAAAAFGGKGKATLDVKLVLTAEKGMIDVAVTHKLSLPKPQRSLPTMLFPTPDGGFSLENPRQLNLFQPKSAAAE